MKNFYFYYLITLATIGLGTTAAQAAEPIAIGLDFSLAAQPTSSAITESAVEQSLDAPLQIPGTAQIPIGKSDEPAHAKLPPAPEATIAQAPAVPEPMPTPATEPELPSSNSPSHSLALEFEPAAISEIGATPPVAPTTAPEPAPSASVAPTAEVLFEGGSNSLVARAIGAAEGTRTPDGDKTQAYGGHSDPGNGKWNLGTFSYQHGANSPEEADQKQLDRLQQQAQTLQQQAQTKGLTLSLAEKLNGLDLANQSPRAALSQGGYIDRLHEAREKGLQNEDAILWARTRAFLDPNTNRWNAPGLGNTTERITADQSRRLRAVAQSIAAQPLPVSTPQLPQDAAAKVRPAAIDRILGFQLQHDQRQSKATPAYATGALFVM